MDATELSGRIRENIERGEWEQAATALADAWRAADETAAVRHCSHPQYTGVWVRFAPRGYPFRLRRELDEARDDQAVLAIILRYVEAWNVPDVAGAPIGLPEGERAASLLDNVDEALVIWLISEFYRHRSEMISLRKNS